MDYYDLKKDGDKWKLLRQGIEGAEKVFETKKEGLDYVKEISQERGGALRIRNESGEIRQQRIYPRAHLAKKSPS